MKKSTTIDLQNYLAPGSRVFTGRNRGIEVRNASKIDDIEAESDEVIIKVPANIYSIGTDLQEAVERILREEIALTHQ